MGVSEFIEQRNLKKVNRKFPTSFYYLSEYPNQNIYQQLLFLASEIGVSQDMHADFLLDHSKDVQDLVFNQIEQLEQKTKSLRSQIQFMQRKVLEAESRYGQAAISIVNLDEGDFKNMAYSETDSGIIFENAINTYNVKIQAKDQMYQYKLYSIDSKFAIRVQK